MVRAFGRRSERAPRREGLWVSGSAIFHDLARQGRAEQSTYTFIVMSLMILIFGPLAALRTPTDIFPEIGIPILGVAFSYAGLSPDDMSARVMANYERQLSTTASMTWSMWKPVIPGLGASKIYFQPDADIRLATSEVSSAVTIGHSHDAGGHAAAQYHRVQRFHRAGAADGFSLNTMSEQQVADQSQNFIVRAWPPCAAAPTTAPNGGKTRSVQIDLDPQAMQARGFRPPTCRTRSFDRTKTTPAGNIKIGTFQYVVDLNNAASAIEAINDMPVKTVNGGTVYLRDVGHVARGWRRRRITSSMWMVRARCSPPC